MLGGERRRRAPAADGSLVNAFARAGRWHGVHSRPPQASGERPITSTVTGSAASSPVPPRAPGIQCAKAASTAAVVGVAVGPSSAVRAGVGLGPVTDTGGTPPTGSGLRPRIHRSRAFGSIVTTALEASASPSPKRYPLTSVIGSQSVCTTPAGSAVVRIREASPPWNPKIACQSSPTPIRVAPSPPGPGPFGVVRACTKAAWAGFTSWYSSTITWRQGSRSGRRRAASVASRSLGFAATYSEPERGRRCWQQRTGETPAEKRAAQQALYGNRRRIRGDRGRGSPATSRGAGGAAVRAPGTRPAVLRRVWVRGHENVRKRVLIQAAGCNLGLLRRLTGVGTPRSLQGRALSALLGLIGRLDACCARRLGQPRGESRLTTKRDYQVALSFAGEQRRYVEEVARHLTARSIAVFYDGFEQVWLWGRDGVETFHEVFSEKAKHVVMFISAEYVNKPWTRVERKAALSRMIREEAEYVLPVRFDDTAVPGLPDTVQYLRAIKYSPAELAALIAERLGVAPFAGKASDVPPPRMTSPVGEVVFDYSNFNGRYIIGSGTAEFETKWTKASNRSIHIYNDPKSINGVALDPSATSISEVTKGGTLDFTSGTRTPKTGQIVVLRNRNRFYAALHVLEIKDDTRGDVIDELRFRFAIQADGSDNFARFRDVFKE